MGASSRMAAAALAFALAAACGTDPPTVPTPTPSAPEASPLREPAPTPSAPNTPVPDPPSPARTLATIPADLAGRIVTTLPTSAQVVALTFDGGASDSGVPSILRTLAGEGVRATFFVTGDFARRYPDRVRAMSDAGHVVGNHSNTHPDFTALGAASLDDELARAEASIAPLTGATPMPWFRFPFGASSAATILATNAGGYACIGWTVDSLGWKGTSGGQSVDSVAIRVVSAAQPGAIVLMHVGANPDDSSSLDADALPSIIDRLQESGYGFVALDSIPR